MPRPASLDIAGIGGALGLEPANAAHEGRLFTLLQVGLGGDRPRWLRSPSQAQVRALLESHPGPRWDPPEALFTSRIPFHGGDHLVLTGGYEGLDTAVEHIVASLFLHKHAPPDALSREAFQLTGAVLRLSDHVVRAAGLGRHEPCGLSNEVVVPATAELRRLLAAVSFTRRELDEITSVGARALEPLIADVADVEAAQDGIGPFGVRPILRDDDRYVLAAPSCLLLALRHHLVLLAKRHRWDGVLVERMLRHGARAVDAALERLGWTKLPMAAVPDPALPVIEQLWGFDDGAALVTIVGDDLSDYRERDAEAPWQGFYRHRDALSERRHLLAKPLFFGESDELPQKAMHLVVLAGVGRPTVWMSEYAREPLLMPEVAFAVADLTTVSIAERGDPLVLWKFAHAGERLDARLILPSPLEPFALWRANGHSYYLGDEKRPTALLSSGEAMELREEIVAQQDLHSVPGPQGRGFVDVRRRFPRMPVPIYRPAVLSDGMPGYYVETPQLRCWVLAGTLRDSTVARIDGLLDTVTYWIWQAAPELAELATRLTRRRFEVVLELEDSPAWEDTAGLPPPGPVATVTAPGVGRLVLRLHPALLPQFARADNDGERQLLRLLLAALDEALPQEERVGWRDADAAAVVERVAPLGRKKMYLVWNPPPERAIDPRNLPSPRPALQQADDAEALDELGEHLRGARGMSVGPIADAERGRVLWEAVTFHLGQLLDLIATLSPDGLVEQLIAVHERFLERGAWGRHTLATREACFGHVADLKALLAEELPSAATAGSALRFVIECVAARPPAGIRRLSLEVQDRLVALAAQVVGRGSVAEAVREGLDDTRVSILASGRLGVGREGRYYSGRERYLEHFLSGELRRAQKSFAGRWQERPASEEAVADSGVLDRAAVDEWGAPIGEILELFGLLDELAAGEPARVLGLDDAVARISSELGWSEETALRVIDEFALRPRESVFEPPPPFEKSDTYPWRFGRRLSLIRRPLVVRPGAGGDDLIYGFRMVDSTGHWLVNELAGGRLKVSSTAMQRAITAVSQRRDEAVNDEVGRMYESVAGMVVRLRVTDVGPLKIARDNGDLLGDIDVLAADTRARVLHAIDTKNLSVARTPYEVVRELRRTFKSEEGKTAAIDRHAERVVWLRRHLRETLAWLRVSGHAEAWRVEPSIVVDTEVPSAFLAELPMRVVDAMTLADELGEHLGVDPP
jgi:hypothetical protein